VCVCVCVCVSVTIDLIADIFRTNNRVNLKFCSLIVKATVQIKKPTQADLFSPGNFKGLLFVLKTDTTQTMFTIYVVMNVSLSNMGDIFNIQA